MFFCPSWGLIPNNINLFGDEPFISMKTARAIEKCGRVGQSDGRE